LQSCRNLLYRSIPQIKIERVTEVFKVTAECPLIAAESHNNTQVIERRKEAAQEQTTRALTTTTFWRHSLGE